MRRGPRTATALSHLMRLVVAGSCLGAAAGAPRLLAQAPIPCTADIAFALMDFWVGRWDVYARGTKVGEDVVVKILDGCAITESWTSATGQHGFSLFYFWADGRTWRQVWITDNALARGGVKEKELISRLPDGGVRFQGLIRPADGSNYLDRTTLTPLVGGRVRQVIEVSTDDGRTWRTTFDAEYVRRL